MNRFLIGAVLVLASVTTPDQGTTHFVLDGNRMYAELGFRRPDGSTHRALAFVDMGSPEMVLRESLFKDLKLDEGRPLAFSIGNLRIEMPAAQVVSEPRPPSSIGSELKVEGILPARVLRNYQVVIDYSRRTLALGRPGTVKPQGVAVPFRMNEKTGLISVDMSVDGTSYPITIDNGSAYTWIRQSAARHWLTAHPDWERGVGAVGASNMMMSGERTETSGTLLRIPRVSVGSVVLPNAGALAAGPGTVEGLDLFDWYSRKNSGPVIGWIGGNVLKAFQITIDYSSRVMYWSKQRDLETHDLDQVGLTLQSKGGAFVVAAIATRNGKPTVENVMPGDTLVRVSGLETATATWGALFAALHGRPGELRTLTIDRDGQRLVVRAPVTAF
jgi:hypothetical protein